MSADHDDLVRSLVVERFRLWPPPDSTDRTPAQVAAEIARATRRPGRRPRRPQQKRATIQPRRQP